MPDPFSLFVGLMFVLGATVGSFLNVVIHRLPNRMSVVRPPSHCPACKTPLKPWWNIPILSWILLRGRCGACRERISIRYPAVELVTALLFAAVSVSFGLSLASFGYALFVAALVAVTFTDLDVYEIPDEVSLPTAVIGVVLRPSMHEVSWYDGFLGALLAANSLRFIRWFFLKFRGVDGMGLGDIKLMALIGGFLGPTGILPVLLIASTLGSVMGIGAMAWTWLLKRGEEETEDEEELEEDDEGPELPRNPIARALCHLVRILFGDGFLDWIDRSVEEEEEDDWEPPPRAVAFGPYLSFAALCQLFFGPIILETTSRTLLFLI